MSDKTLPEVERRSGIDRRKSKEPHNGPERRSGEDRRSGIDRRKSKEPYNGPERRSGTDRRCRVDRRSG